MRQDRIRDKRSRNQSNNVEYWYVNMWILCSVWNWNVLYPQSSWILILINAYVINSALFCQVLDLFFWVNTFLLWIFVFSCMIISTIYCTITFRVLVWCLMQSSSVLSLTKNSVSRSVRSARFSVEKRIVDTIPKLVFEHPKQKLPTSLL